MIAAVIVSSVFGGLAGWTAFSILSDNFGKTNGRHQKVIATQKKTVTVVDEESAVISAVEKISPSVVNIVASKDLPKIERYYRSPFDDDFFRQFFDDEYNDFFGFGIPPKGERKENGGTEKRKISSGTGFVVSQDGYIVTNKHVVAYDDVEYTVLMNDEKKYSAKVIARDPINDLAIVKIEANNLKTAELGSSSDLKVGQKVIAIGNALGEFSNTVSTGVISGLSRSIVASGGLETEQLIDVIQTDASINFGNSGGPLLNIKGQVIGINTAIAKGAQNIGFAIPVDEAKYIIDNVRENGRIVRPWLGVRYVQINKSIKEENNLSVDYGALIVRGKKITDLAVVPGSPADKAGLMENDIILEVNNNKIDDKNPLNRAIAKLKPGDEVALKIMRKGKEKEIKVKLEERK